MIQSSKAGATTWRKTFGSARHRHQIIRALSKAADALEKVQETFIDISLEQFQVKLDDDLRKSLSTDPNLICAESPAAESSKSPLALPSATKTALTAQRIFELANKAYSLYLTRNVEERGELLKSVLLNCTTDGVSLSPAYRKPFDLIFQPAKNQEWSGEEDLNR